MKKTFRSYTLVWGICFALFQLIAFIVPNDFKANFWIGWLFISAAFCGQLYCARLTFRAENVQKLFYSLSLITISYLGLVAMLFFGGLTMAIPAIPYWVGIILCAAIVAFTAVAVIGTKEAVKTVETIDQSVKEKTVFIKLLIADAETLMANASPENKETVKKVWETLRYSDPVSNPALTSVEAQINIKFSEFSTSVLAGAENATALSQELLILIEDRNRKCKILK